MGLWGAYFCMGAYKRDEVVVRFLLGTGRMPHPGGAMGVTLSTVKGIHPL